MSDKIYKKQVGGTEEVKEEVKETKNSWGINNV